MIISSLKKLGLTEAEAKTYLACVELGSATVGPISTQANMPRSTVYGNLANLTKKGFLFTFSKRGKTNYSVNNPRFLKKTAEEYLQSVESVLPELESSYYSKEARKPNVRYFEGTNGIEVVREELLSEAKEVLVIGSAEKEAEVFSGFVKKIRTERVKRGIKRRFIATKSERALLHKAIDDELSLTKIIKKETPFTSIMYLWENKTVLISLSGNISITIIEDPEIYKIHKEMYESLWNFHPEDK